MSVLAFKRVPPPKRSAPVVPLRVPQADRDAFTAAMRYLAGGVSIVTVGHGERRSGLTATSLTSLSVDPPSLLVCINKSSSGLALLHETGRFGVSVLGHEHRAIADRFAGRDGVQGAARYAGAEWLAAANQPPVLADALASFDCEVEEVIERFSHAIVIGRVTASRAQGGSAALAYWCANYARVGEAQA